MDFRLPSSLGEFCESTARPESIWAKFAVKSVGSRASVTLVVSLKENIWFSCRTITK